MKPWPRVWCGGPAEPQGPPALVVTFEAPTKGEANERSFWGANKRKKKQDAELELALFGAPIPSGPWCVRMVRLAPGVGLDDDNLGGAFKRIRDRLAQWLGVDDRNPVVAFVPAQEKRRGPIGLRIEVWGGEAAP